MDTRERLQKYRRLTKISETHASEFVRKHKHDRRFVELVELGNQLMEGLKLALEEQTQQ